MSEMNSKKEFEKLTTPEKFEAVRFLKVFIVRHGLTEYKERESVKKFGKWNPGIHDITPEGEDELRDTALRIIQEINPKTDIVVFLSSPRARAQSSMRILDDEFRQRGIEIYQESPVLVEMLRSGGDMSPVTGDNNEIKFQDQPQNDYWDIEEEGEEQPQGKRFKKFLSYFASINQTLLAEKIKKTSSRLNGKIPVFVAITHGEVTHAGASPAPVYKKSFLGEVFPDKKRLKLPRGRSMKLVFDLENPGNFSVTIPPETSLSGSSETKNLHFNSKNGSVENIY
ncbi:MAG: hypothetical protein A2915_02665 [Candidatus Yanofskybacteria bacterium RIFCSPLOWO2_01_FULL_41_34]|uniref:Uncharacterized protein n=1 Tax=Candidatus Yanofskybacteria bacterium RIFCSPHIGHO2_01_FULL_41_26 TaxID=1802661 RepID=A0A1F8EEJ2_9BACT|nr:MAG: hypothetical protein A2649_03925 [Candidatus Yanofskybacteria bacterium RIFCSPHIGHO2_01_FULL_41_26]OGN20939.1 MAG: hypothetical protein A2915_02665 [Candidatus Yanofskybacteria bacterium RIFCSPLOWO2_01_FULL_41_34]